MVSERGAELIEFAIVLPVMLLIVMGIVDFGFMFQRYVVLTNAAMEGARVAVLPGYQTADVQARVDRVCGRGRHPRGPLPRSRHQRRFAGAGRDNLAGQSKSRSRMPTVSTISGRSPASSAAGYGRSR